MEELRYYAMQRRLCWITTRISPGTWGGGGDAAHSSPSTEVVSEKKCKDDFSMVS
jgi:hypothetical protein